MSFKVKNRKKATIDNRTTVDAKHNTKIKYFKELKKSLPVKKKKLSNFKEQYQKLIAKPLREFTDEEFELKNDLEDKIEILEKEVNQIESGTEEKEYYQNTSEILFNYYDNSNKTNQKGKVKEQINLKSGKTVMDWLNKSNQVNNSSKQDICDNYLSLTDPSFVKNVKNNYEDFCLKCNVEKKTHLADGCMVCQNCGTSRLYCN